MSVTVPMEFSFGSGGSLKAARRLRNLEFKRNRPTTHPTFAAAKASTTGSIIKDAYTATKGKTIMANRAGPLNMMPKNMPSVHTRSSIPIPIMADRMSGDEDSGGQLLPKPSSMNEVVPSLAQPTISSANGNGNGNGSKKGIVIGGGLALLVAFLIFFVFSGKKGRKRRAKVRAKVGRRRRR